MLRTIATTISPGGPRDLILSLVLSFIMPPPTVILPSVEDTRGEGAERHAPLDDMDGRAGQGSEDPDGGARQISGQGSLAMMRRILRADETCIQPARRTAPRSLVCWCLQTRSLAEEPVAAHASRPYRPPSTPPLCQKQHGHERPRAPTPGHGPHPAWRTASKADPARPTPTAPAAHRDDALGGGGAGMPEATLPACDTQIRLAPSRSFAWPLSACSRNWQLLQIASRVGQSCWPEAPSMDISHLQTRSPSQCCCSTLAAADPDRVSSRCSPPPLHPGTGFATTHSPPPAEFYALMLCTTQRHPKIDTLAAAKNHCTRKSHASFRSRPPPPTPTTASQDGPRLGTGQRAVCGAFCQERRAGSG